MPVNESQEIERMVAELIGKSRKMNSNLAIMSFAGAGSSYILKSYVKKHPEVVYIAGEGQNLGEYSIVDTGAELALEYMKQADLGQKMVLVLKTGREYYSEAGKEIRLHSYISGVIGARSRQGCERMVKEIKGSIEGTEEIYRLSGGIGKLVKFLAVGAKDNGVLKGIVEDVKGSLDGYEVEDLEELGIIRSGKVVSELLGDVFAMTQKKNEERKEKE